MNNWLCCILIIVHSHISTKTLWFLLGEIFWFSGFIFYRWGSYFPLLAFSANPKKCHLILFHLSYGFINHMGSITNHRCVQMQSNNYFQKGSNYNRYNWEHLPWWGFILLDVFSKLVLWWKNDMKGNGASGAVDLRWLNWCNSWSSCVWIKAIRCLLHVSTALLPKEH